MKVYAIIGGSQQTIIPDALMYQPVENEILMVSERPDGIYIAKEDGTWVIDSPSTTEQIAQIDKQYEQDKSQLLNYYTEAVMREDTALQADVKAELTALDHQYDFDIQNVSEV